MTNKAEHRRRNRADRTRADLDRVLFAQPRTYYKLVNQTTPALRRIRRRLGGVLNLFGMFLCPEAHLQLDLSRLILKSRELI